MARLDSRDRFPSGMEDYLSQNGWHFNKRMCEWAVSHMSKNDKPVTPATQDTVEALLKRYGVKLKNDIGYDKVFVYNMMNADYMESSIDDELHSVRFIKDYLDDTDGYSEIAFTRFYADCIGKGIPIPWEDML